MSFCGKTGGKQRRRSQKTLRMLCIVHEELIYVSESVCACVCGRWRAKIQKFARKIARISTQKTAHFRRRTRAQGIKKVRRSSAHVLQVVRHLPVISARFRQALRACRVQNLRRISSTLLRFQPKNRKFLRQNARQTTPQRSTNVAHVVQRP